MPVLRRLLLAVYPGIVVALASAVVGAAAQVSVREMGVGRAPANETPNDCNRLSGPQGWCVATQIVGEKLLLDSPTKQRCSAPSLIFFENFVAKLPGLHRA